VLLVRIQPLCSLCIHLFQHERSNLILLTLLLELASADCDRTLSDLYNIQSQLKEMKYCECMTSESLDEARDYANTVFKSARTCPELQAQVDSLKTVFTKLRKDVK
jgi:hypothetical protein